MCAQLVWLFQTYIISAKECQYKFEIGILFVLIVLYGFYQAFAIGSSDISNLTRGVCDHYFKYLRFGTGVYLTLTRRECPPSVYLTDSIFCF